MIFVSVFYSRRKDLSIININFFGFSGINYTAYCNYAIIFWKSLQIVDHFKNEYGMIKTITDRSDFERGKEHENDKETVS